MLRNFNGYIQTCSRNIQVAQFAQVKPAGYLMSLSKALFVEISKCQNFNFRLICVSGGSKDGEKSFFGFMYYL